GGSKMTPLMFFDDISEKLGSLSTKIFVILKPSNCDIFFEKLYFMGSPFPQNNFFPEGPKTGFSIIFLYSGYFRFDATEQRNFKRLTHLFDVRQLSGTSGDAVRYQV